MCSSDWFSQYKFFQKTWNWILDFISYFTFSIILYFIFVLGVGSRLPVSQNTHFLPTNNLLRSDFIKCHLTLLWTDSRDTRHIKPAVSQARKEKKKYIRKEAATWICRVSSSSPLSCSTFTSPSTTPPATHYRRHGEEHGHEDTVYETEGSEMKTQPARRKKRS